MVTGVWKVAESSRYIYMKLSAKISLVSLNKTKGRHQNSLSVFKNLPPRVTEPSRSNFSYTVGDHCKYFTKLTGP